MSQKKRNFSGNQKIHILRDHLLDKTPVSDICVQYGIRPNMFYRWQKELFENGAKIFGRSFQNSDREKELREEIERLEKKLKSKNEVVSELMEDYIELKKRIGENSIRGG